jgi:hypothetical protein
MVPGAYGTGAPSGHSPFPKALVSQPPLQGLGSRIPDFMWIAKDSETICPVLIEIEKPTKRWFREDGVPDAHFTQALDQITEWKAWFKQAPNIQVFRDFYRIPDDLWRARNFEPSYILIYGSRREFEAREDLARKRRLQARDNEYHMTFDRLAPDPRADGLLTVKITRPAEYIALAWPPTVQFSPFVAEDFALIQDKESAITASSWLTAERRAFLESRCSYWDTWGRSSPKGLIGVSDVE